MVHATFYCDISITVTSFLLTHRREHNHKVYANSIRNYVVRPTIDKD